MGKRHKSDIDSFEKITSELKGKFHFLIDVYFDDHHGFWMTHTKTESMEHDDFEGVLCYLSDCANDAQKQ